MRQKVKKNRKLTPDYYMLKGKRPVAVDSVYEWVEEFEKNRTVSKTVIEGGEKSVGVSTIFLGLDHNFSGKGPPILFETLVFGGKLDQTIERYTTWRKAEKGHKKMVEEVLATVIPKHIPEKQHTKYIAKRKLKVRTDDVMTVKESKITEEQEIKHKGKK